MNKPNAACAINQKSAGVLMNRMKFCMSHMTEPVQSVQRAIKVVQRRSEGGLPLLNRTVVQQLSRFRYTDDHFLACFNKNEEDSLEKLFSELDDANVDSVEEKLLFYKNMASQLQRMILSEEKQKMSQDSAFYSLNAENLERLNKLIAFLERKAFNLPPEKEKSVPYHTKSEQVNGIMGNSKETNIDQQVYIDKILSLLDVQPMTIYNIAFAMDDSVENVRDRLSKLQSDGYIDDVRSGIFRKILPSLGARSLRKKRFSDQTYFTLTCKGFFKLHPIISFSK